MPQKIRNRLNFLISLAYFAAIIALTYLGLKYALGWVLPFIVAFCIVSIVNPLIRFVNNKLKINHKVASVAVMVLVYGLIGFALFELIIQLFYVLLEIFTMLPAYYETDLGPALSRLIQNVDNLIGKLPPILVDRLSGLDGDIMGAVQTLLVNISQGGITYVSQFTGQIPTFVIAFIFTIMLTFFIGMQYDTVTAFLKAQLPDRVKGMVSELKAIVNDIILRYIKAIIKLMMITFLELAAGLLVLGTPNAVIIALGIAVFDALPLFGTGAIMVPWALVELIQGNLTYAAGLAIVYAIITVVRNIIEPHIVGKKLGLNPIVSIVSIYLGFKLMGIIGMIIMPMVTQIVLELHKKGVIKLFRPVEEPPATASAVGGGVAGTEDQGEETVPDDLDKG